MRKTTSDVRKIVGSVNTTRFWMYFSIRGRPRAATPYAAIGGATCLRATPESIRADAYFLSQVS